MAGNPNCWSNTHPPQPLFSSQYININTNTNINVSSDSSLSLDSLADHHLHSQEPPTSQSSWTQFLLSSSSSISNNNNNNNNIKNNLIDQFQPNRKLLDINWEEQMIMSSTVINAAPNYKLFDIHDNEKQQHYSATKQGEHDHDNEEVRANRSSATNNKTILISYTTDDQSSEPKCNSTDTGLAMNNKKPRVHPWSQPPLQVRKEKLGDRITGLHQLVSPFGKTDTASVLFEAIGYIRFLQTQIEALCSPYFGHASKNIRDNNQQNVEVEVGGGKEKQKDLKSRGLCLVPVSCTHNLGSDNGADYWTHSNYPPNGF